MKRFLCVLLFLCFLSLSASAEGFRYSSTSVAANDFSNSRYDVFNQSGTLGCLIPGLAEGLVPQGVGYLSEQDWLLVAGYRNDKDSSALIAVERESGAIRKEVFLQYQDGSLYAGHAGGVCVTGKNIFIANASHLYRISLDKFLSLPESGKCAFDEEIPVPVNASYCACAEGVLWVGEFQYGSDYQTDRSHRAKTADGTMKAWTCGYRLRDDTENELAPYGTVAVPDVLLEMTERIQGVTVLNGEIYLSQSYGRNNFSVLYKYAPISDRPADSEGTVDGMQIPLWFLDKNTQTDILICPPMTECLCTVGDDVYVLFESGAESYRGNGACPCDRFFVLSGF